LRWGHRPNKLETECFDAIGVKVEFQGIGVHPEVVERANRAIEASGLKVKEKAIRGGIDGSSLCAMGYSTPNIFAGGMLFHSRREWIAVSALAKAVETILNLASLP